MTVETGEGKTLEFPCNRWLSKTEDDGKISRDLILAGTSDMQGSTGGCFESDFNSQHGCGSRVDWGGGGGGGELNPKI